MKTWGLWYLQAPKEVGGDLQPWALKGWDQPAVASSEVTPLLLVVGG